MLRPFCIHNSKFIITCSINLINYTRGEIYSMTRLFSKTRVHNSFSIWLFINFFKVFKRSFGIRLNGWRIFAPISWTDFTMLLHKLEGLDQSDSFINRSSHCEKKNRFTYLSATKNISVQEFGCLFEVIRKSGHSFQKLVALQTILPGRSLIDICLTHPYVKREEKKRPQSLLF